MYVSFSVLSVLLEVNASFPHQNTLGLIRSKVTWEKRAKGIGGTRPWQNFSHICDSGWPAQLWALHLLGKSTASSRTGHSSRAGGWLQPQAKHRPWRRWPSLLYLTLYMSPLWGDLRQPSFWFPSLVLLQDHMRDGWECTQKMLGLLSSQHLRFDCRWEPVGSFSPCQPGG